VRSRRRLSAVTIPERYGGIVSFMRAGDRLVTAPGIWVILIALDVALAAAWIPLAGFARQLTVANVVSEVVVVGGYLCVGALVARRQPRNPIGWLLLLVVLFTALSTDAGYYAVLAYRLGHRALPAAPLAVLLQPLYILAAALFPLIILLFPEGRLSRRWRRAAWTYAACALLAVVAAGLGPAIAAVTSGHVKVDASGDLVTSGSPGGRATGALAGVVTAIVVALIISFVVRQVLSWRHASGERRQQLKWLASGSVVTLATFAVGIQFSSTSAVSEILTTGLVILPVSIGVGILKYRLYDIDRIISRTLAYAIVTGLLVGVYAGLVLLTTQVFGFRTPVAVAASTLAAAALFSPVRGRVQGLVDRRFNRVRYDAERTVAAFEARLKDAVDLDAVRGDLADTVHRALEPAHVSVWVSKPD
jgi:MFS family permease